MLGFISWIVFGFVIGLIARAILPGRDSMGFVATTLLGIVGAVVGGWAGQFFGWYAPGEPAGWIFATVGAVIVLAIYNAVVRSRAVRNLPVVGTRPSSREKPKRVA